MTEALRGSRGERVPGSHFRAGSVKMRLIEAHPPASDEEGADHLLAVTFGEAGMDVKRFADNLFLVTGDEIVLAVDTLDSRFWQIYSTSLSEPIQRTLKRVVTRETKLDSAWIPKSILLGMDGTHRWLRSSFESDDLLGDSSPTRRWRARFEGRLARRALGHPWLRSSLRPCQRGCRDRLCGSRDGTGSRACVRRLAGELHNRPGRFQHRRQLSDSCRRALQNLRPTLERRHQLRFLSADEAEHGIELEGDVAVIPFAEPIRDIEQVVEGLFQAKEPFRLWAVPRQIDEREWEANAVDLHVGQPCALRSHRCGFECCSEIRPAGTRSRGFSPISSIA
jgi:hypothetical protein